jgi:hypothetical protein
MKYYWRYITVALLLVILFFSMPIYVIMEQEKDRQRSKQHTVSVSVILVTGKEVEISFQVPPNYELGVGGSRGSYWLYYIDNDSKFPKPRVLRNGIIHYRILKP